MFSQQIGGINNWNQDYQTLGFGNYGYGLYSQDIEPYRNPFTRGINIGRDIDFIPVGNNAIGPYASFPAAYHQHYPY